MRGLRIVVVVFWGTLCGCAATPTTPPPASQSVGTAWRQRDRKPSDAPTTYRERQSPSTTMTPSGSSVPGSAVAKVNGRSVDRRVLVDLLMRSRGAAVLEQLVAYEAIAALAAEKNLTIVRSDVAFERRMAAERVWNPLAPFTTAPLDDASADRLLSEVLAQKNISSPEFTVVLRRNAYLRKIVASEQTFSEAEYQAEFERAYGLRVRVRHIQLATPAEVARVQERLDAGEPFEAVARTFSANQGSASDGGLLEPFSRSEDQLPQIFRQTAFAMEPGAVSGAVRVGEWYHLIRVEERLPAQQKVIGAVRDELTARLRQRLSEGAMFSLYEKTVREATIEIFDPVLREAYHDRTKKRGG